jgi:hypothetical protein
MIRCARPRAGCAAAVAETRDIVKSATLRSFGVRFVPALLVPASLLLGAMPGFAQPLLRHDVRGEVQVGSEIERYLRILQVAGVAPLHPWTIRGFSVSEVDQRLPADSLHPWAERYPLVPDSVLRRARVRAVRPRTQLFYNSAFPFGENEGAVWTGRGVTTSVEGGFALESGPLSLTVAPIAFVAQNADFATVDPGAGHDPLRDPRNPSYIDLPQRFGDGTYARIDPGESTLRLDLPLVTLGASTASQQWGPAADSPLLLGNNAGGFPHLFLGSARPVNLWVGRLHGRMMWGTPAQTDLSPMGGHGRRFLASAVASFTPRGVPGLEVGGARLFHVVRPDGGPGLGEALLPVGNLFKVELARRRGGDGSSVDNQLAAAFFRWVHPRDGVELWGEFLREDHSFDLRDFVLEPDHSSAFLLGGRKVWSASGGSLRALRAEFVNGRITHLSRVRPQIAPYVHAEMRQGHTHRGQLLASPGAHDGLRSTIAFDVYHPRGRWTGRWLRSLRDGPPNSPVEATNGLGGEAVFFLGRFDVAAGATAVHQLNRNFQGDAFNLNLVLRVSQGL